MLIFFFFFFKQKTAYEIGVRLVGSEMCIRDRYSDVKKKTHKLRAYRQYDKDKFAKSVKKATKKIITEPRNASVKRKNGKFVVIKEKTGYTLNMDETFTNFKKAIESGKKKAKLDVVKKKAKYTSKDMAPVSYTHLRAHETDSYLVCRLLLEKKKKNKKKTIINKTKK